jgi:hypothetical protein
MFSTVENIERRFHTNETGRAFAPAKPASVVRALIRNCLPPVHDSDPTPKQQNPASIDSLPGFAKGTNQLKNLS